VITLDFLADLAALAYVLVLVLAAFDVVVPVLPSESAVVLGGVLAWQGRLHVVPLILAAAAGAVLGDHMSYSIGRWTRRGRPQPAKDRGKVARLQAWAAEQLDKRGPVLLVIARFVPGGRTAATFIAGRTAYPLHRFTPTTIFAGLLWASFATALGYIGGSTFHDQTLLATGLGIALAIGFGALMELVTSWHRRRVQARAAVAQGSDDDRDEQAA
jgi:membrane protein DedA with SNARE-associated domain